jgi:hypothetical protein
VLVLSAPDERGLTKALARVDRLSFRPADPHGSAGAPLLPFEGRKIHIHPGWPPESVVP